VQRSQFCAAFTNIKKFLLISFYQKVPSLPKKYCTVMQILLNLAVGGKVYLPFLHSPANKFNNIELALRVSCIKVGDK
jgi:hypothetical protein